ncbi:Lymphocyte cytosolic protein 2 [Trichoplax sp. H2]|nr:Lymphocyte cytosolic protein 2 [Trichoplax sp. H2]|eukprot:RDD41666.1 Lymphocyte cytosolic protein 2 [Trichoplax sp. H2]
MQKYEQQVDENKSNLATAQAKSMAGSLHNSPPARKTRQLTEQVDSKLVKPLRQQLTGQLEKRSSEKSADAIFTDTSKSKANPTFEKGQSNLNKKTLPEVDPGHNNVASSPFILKDQRFVNQNYPSRDEKVPKQTNQGLELLKNAKSAISPSSALDNAHQSQKKLDSQRITPKRVAKSDNLSNSPIVASPIAVSKKPVTGKVKALAQNLIGSREELNQATNIRQPSEQTNKLGSASPQSSRKFITTTFQSSNQEHFTPKKAAFSPTTHATNDSKINKNKARPKGIYKGDFDRYNDGNTSNTAKEDYDDITEATTDPSSVHHHADLDVHNLSELEDHSWYHSNLTRQEAEEKLSKYVKNGTFLVRNGQQSNNYVLSIIAKKSVAHIRILCRPEDEKYILGERKQQEMPFNSVPELIAFYHAEQMVLMSGHQVFLTKSCSY